MLLGFRTAAAVLATLWAAASVAGTPSADGHRKRDLRALSDTQVEAIAKLDPPEWETVTGGHLGQLLIPRVSGTDNNTLVQNYISSVFAKLGWHEDKYATRMPTPHGELPFTNLVYTFDPDAPRKLVLSAHFDSKWFAEGGFIGATDSSAPCATMIDVAEALTPLLKARAARVKAGKPLLTSEVDEREASEVTLQLVFFDGEEAFEQWTYADSLYGSRFLAETWEDTLLPDHHPLNKRRMGPLPNVLDTMDVLVLLDLLGAPKPRMRSFFPETRWLFDELAATDKRLRAAKLVDTSDDMWFSPIPGHPGGIDDDHRPFLHRGVPILHLIPSPFPSVWHSLKDNADALDLPTLRRWNRVMRVWTASYLGLAAEDAAPHDEDSGRPLPNTAAGPDTRGTERTELGGTDAPVR